jgi:glycine cleavage system H protein
MEKFLSRKCPFLEEEKVLICRAFPLKKPIPLDKVYAQENFCLKGNYWRCPVYKEVAKEKERTSHGVCPFVEVENVSFCKLFPAKKLSVSGVYELGNPCITERHQECILFLTVSRGDLSLSTEERPYVDPNCKYLKGHFWIKEEGEGVKLGLDDFGQLLLGPVKRITLPPEGTILKKGDEFLTIETEKGVFQLLSPLEGEVRRINRELFEHPDLLNREPYGEGWILIMRILGHPFHLMSAEEAKSHIFQKLQWLSGFLCSEETMADGGEIKLESLKTLTPEKQKVLIEELLLKEIKKEVGDGALSVSMG